jgi:hypothetical protein
MVGSGAMKKEEVTGKRDEKMQKEEAHAEKQEEKAKRKSRKEGPGKIRKDRERTRKRSCQIAKIPELS